MVVTAVIIPFGIFFPHMTEVKAPFQEGYGVLLSTHLHILRQHVLFDLGFNLDNPVYKFFHSFIFVLDGFVIPAVQLIIPHYADYFLFSVQCLNLLSHPLLHEVYQMVESTRFNLHISYKDPPNEVLEKVSNSLLWSYRDRLPLTDKFAIKHK